VLTDHKLHQERWARRRQERRAQATAFGRFIATLDRWEWFLTLTLRDWESQQEEPWERGEIRREASITICQPDPRLARYTPSSRFSSSAASPLPEGVLKRIETWLLDLQRLAGHPIGWVIAEEFGRLGGRCHCHILVAGVSRLNRRWCLSETHRRFGYTRIERFDAARGAAFYVAKYAGRLPGALHFGGTLAGVDLSKCGCSRSQGGGRDVAASVALSRSHFHMCLSRWHR
jgi:hypothetical protein